MFTPTVKQKLIRKLQHSFVSRNMCPLRRTRINNTDFTIISNNCWGGICYEYFGLQKQSPTVGCWFFAEDYLRFISSLKKYLEKDIIILSPEESTVTSALFDSLYSYIPSPICPRHNAFCLEPIRAVSNSSVI